MVSQAGYHANHADGKRPAHSYSPYMPANRYTESRVYVPSIPNNEGRGLLCDAVEKGEGSTRKRIAVACGRCRQRKIRCSGDKGQGMPCTNCHNAGVTPCLFLRVSSREATIKADFDYNTHISRALAHRAPVPPLPSSLSGLSGPMSSPLSGSLSGPASSHYGTFSDFSPSSGSSSSDPYRSTNNLYPYTHKAYYHSLPQPPWTPGYTGDCGSAPGNYSAPQPYSSYGSGAVSEQTSQTQTSQTPQTSQLMPPFTWDGRPPPPPLPLRVQAPDSTGVSCLPPPVQSHSHHIGHHHHDHDRDHDHDYEHEHNHGDHHHGNHTPQETQPQPRCHCRECIEGHGQAKLPTDLTSPQVSSSHDQQNHQNQSHHEHDVNQYIHGELVYRPGQTGAEDTLAHSSVETLQLNSDRNTISNNSSSSSNSNSSNSCSSATQDIQAVPISRAPSQGSLGVVDSSAPVPVPVSHFKQEMVSSRSAASSPAPVQTQSKPSMQPPMPSMQAHIPMPMPPPLPSQEHVHASSPYASVHTSAANSSENLARGNLSNYPAASSDISRRSSVHVPSHVPSHAYSKDVYHDTGLYSAGLDSPAPTAPSAISASSTSAPANMPDRASEGSIFSEQERNVVGTQGPGPMGSCLDSYTYDSGPSCNSNANSNDNTSIKSKSSLSLTSLHGVYGRQNRKKSSADSLVKARPYSPAAGPVGSMLPPSHHIHSHNHNHGHGYDHAHTHIGSSRQPSTPVCGSPLPPPMHTYTDLQAHDVKADSPY